MCGLVGYYCENPQEEHARYLQALFGQAKIRGLHAFGVGWHSNGINGAWRYPTLNETQAAIMTVVGHLKHKQLIAHARYATSGDWQDQANNQPLLVDNYTLAFNGVIDMGTKEEMETRHGCVLSTYNDGEVFLRKLIDGGEKEAQMFLRDMNGSFAGVWLNPNGSLKIARNEKRPLWMWPHDNGLFVASTKDIFKRALNVEPYEVMTGQIWDARDYID